MHREKDEEIFQYFVSYSLMREFLSHSLISNGDGFFQEGLNPL